MHKVIILILFILCTNFCFVNANFVQSDDDKRKIDEKQTFEIKNINIYDLDANQQKRARSLFKRIYCPICDGETIDTSQTPVAFEMRQRILKAMKDGKNDKEIVNEMINIYGANIIDYPTNKIDIFLILSIPLLLFFIFLRYIINNNKNLKLN